MLAQGQAGLAVILNNVLTSGLAGQGYIGFLAGLDRREVAAFSGSGTASPPS
jgi:hypothetical protein